MYTATLLLQGLLLLFHQLTTLVDFYPFNNVRPYTIGERLPECIVNGVLMALPPTGFYLHSTWMMTAALIIYPVLLAGEFLSWWKPYFFGAGPRWQQTYDQLFRHTIIVLPPIKNHPVPNLQHCLLHGLTLLVASITYMHYFSAR